MAFRYEKCKSSAQGRAGKKPSEYPYRYEGEDEFEESESSRAEAGLPGAMDERRNATSKVTPTKSPVLRRRDASGVGSATVSTFSIYLSFVEERNTSVACVASSQTQPRATRRTRQPCREE
jgi:hypothetical protein